MNKTEFIRHSQLTQSQLIEIIKVKSVAWPYTFDQQQFWIDNNISEADIHVILKNAESVLGYINLIDISITIDDQYYKGYGVGNVCAIQRGKGWGKEIINHVNNYLVENDKVGLLFCKNELVNFYKDNKWSLVSMEQLNLTQINDEINSLVYNSPLIKKELRFNGKPF